MSDLLELAERCEKAEGPDRELDLAIWQAIDPPAWSQVREPWPIGRAYTASIDAALTLVPVVVDEDGPRRMDYILEHVNAGLTIGSRVGHNDPDRTSWGATDALALCAAALRARAA